MSRSARRVGRPGAIALVIAFALGACGAAATSVAPATPAPSGTMLVEAKEYLFTPSTMTLPEGTVTFSVRNAGNEAHEFEVSEGDALVGKVDGLLPGLTKDLAVTLEVGEYAFVCRLNGHDQLGMKGTLTVTGS